MRTHFILFVRDQAASAAFYRAALDRAPGLDVPGMTEFSLGEGATLGLMPEAGIRRLLGGAIDPAAAGGAPRCEVYLVVDDPAACHARALAAGAREVSALAPRGWGHDVAYSQDPDGHLLAFAAERAAEARGLS
ncbi:MAG: VOC family protein [bacterium]